MEHFTISKGTLEVRDTSDLAPIHRACRSRALEVVEDLLNARADDVSVKSSNEEATTPLHIACMIGHSEVISRLQKVGALDLNAHDGFGRTPVYLRLQVTAARRCPGTASRPQGAGITLPYGRLEKTNYSFASRCWTYDESHPQLPLPLGTWDR